MSGPPPSSLILLSELQNCEQGQKVRFLGCVDAYAVQTATLHLRHNYPTSEPPKTVQVNIRILLESIKRNELDVGCWVNVIGYVERTKDKGISVQAIAVWDAGNIDLNAYESAIDARKASGI